MFINGHDFKFAYTVEAYLAIADLKMTDSKSVVTNIRNNMRIALIMSAAYEHQQKVLNPEHEINALTLDMLQTLNFGDLKILDEELSEAMKIGNEVSVNLKPSKKKGTERESSSTVPGFFFMGRFSKWLKKKFSRHGTEN